MKKLIKDMLLILLATVIACAPALLSMSCNDVGKNDSAINSGPEDMVTPVPEPDSSGSETDPTEEKKDLYTDSNGNIYEIVKVYTASDGRELVLFQNIETMTVSLAVKRYFDENYHLIEE